jgi:threonine/homoserine/homoserine lactone efflux protein
MEPFVSFLGVAAVAMLIPGPDTFVVLRASLAQGPRAGCSAAAGSASGNVVWGAATVAGVAGVLAASAGAFAALKLAGAAYLVVLGARALLAARRGDPLAPANARARNTSAWTAYRTGLASDLLNVKVGLFWTALVPQFVTADSAGWLPPAMVASMGVIVFTWLTGYAYLAARLSPSLQRTRNARLVNGTIGVVLLALGARLAAMR